ncbi:hypothetical protein [Kiloniella sp.]|uniref:hypothetical protein n=1 Tax=Kiloniella sp. TaxID=1938587 RepID=UPI003B02434C
MHINLFKHIGATNKPQHAIYQRPHQTAPSTAGATTSEPKDTVTLSPEGMKAIHVDHKSHHQAVRARVHDNKINSLEKWVDKAASKTEANDGNIPFGMEWKLNYISTRIDKALTSNIDENGKAINLTDAQQEKLNLINDKINSLLSPASIPAAIDENAAVVSDPIGDSSALAAPTEESEPPTTATVVPAEETTPTEAPDTTVALADPETILDILEENQEAVIEETV